MYNTSNDSLAVVPSSAAATSCAGADFHASFGSIALSAAEKPPARSFFLSTVCGA